MSTQSDKTLLSFAEGRELYKALKSFANVVDVMHPELKALEGAFETAHANYSIDTAMSLDTFYKIVDYLMMHVEKFASPSELTLLAAIENSGLSAEMIYLFARRYENIAESLSRSVFNQITGFDIDDESVDDDSEVAYRNILVRVPFLGKELVYAMLGTKFETITDVLAMVHAHLEHNSTNAVGDFVYSPANYLPDLLLPYARLRLILEQVGWHSKNSKKSFTSLFGTDVFDGSPIFVGKVSPLLDSDEDDPLKEMIQGVKETAPKTQAKDDYHPQSPRSNFGVHDPEDRDMLDNYLDNYGEYYGARYVNPRARSHEHAPSPSTYPRPGATHGAPAYSSTYNTEIGQYASPANKPITYKKNGFPILAKDIQRLLDRPKWRHNYYFDRDY